MIGVACVTALSAFSMVLVSLGIATVVSIGIVLLVEFVAALGKMNRNA